ncbi:helix-turn-helix domain-containing protein [Lentimicrobium sp.]|uniref:helix-turn-helix domain-containing protein n=1 Tax=Lentimicrobium sp. TaxID=2034841 RepID=UPI002CBB94FE|nr:helix-turn-helix domain-containing protein [Lentimicrobium sp.]HPJ63791.1 helix-turn-helix domain-containing protein [Lentimicrobium sp.]
MNTIENITRQTQHKSIAVLPFVNLSSDPDNEYFSDGITEEIINALTTVQGLKVIARTSSFTFKNKNIDIRTIGSQLGVSTVLEGSVRKVKNRVRITAQLINTTDGSHFWSKNFDREMEDIFSLQDEISLLISDQIRENFGHFDIPSHPHNYPTRKIDAYDLFLKGSYHLKRKGYDDVKKSISFFRDAINVDPNYAEAFSMLGEAYIHAAGFGMMSTKEAHELARESAENAIALDAENAYAHKVLAFVKLFYDWDWEAAYDAYNKAIAYGLPEQNEFISYYYIFVEEDYERAIQVARKVTETDPLHVISHWQLGLTYYFARRFKEAIAAFSAALDIDPNFSEAIRYRGLVKGYLGKYQEALSDIHRALELSSGQGLANLDLLVVKILMGKKKEVVAVMEKSEYVDSSDPAILYSLLDMPDEAIFWLKKACQERSVMMVSLKNFWVWDNLRDDPRFKEMYDQMNFPPSVENQCKTDPVTIGQITTTNASLLNESEIRYYLQQLEQLVHEEKIYTDSLLSLRQVADRIGLHPNRLSWLLNDQLHKNFNEYINAFRLETFKVKALDPQNKHITILGLAYESGFNSKTSFNSYFKKMEGITPTAWVKKQEK